MEKARDEKLEQMIWTSVSRCKFEARQRTGHNCASRAKSLKSLGVHSRKSAVCCRVICLEQLSVKLFEAPTTPDDEGLVDCHASPAFNLLPQISDPDKLGTTTTQNRYFSIYKSLLSKQKERRTELYLSIAYTCMEVIRCTREFS